MHTAIQDMIEARRPQTSDDYANALREILQLLALRGLERAGFFAHAAFYGGTALRILYGLPRYSEDLDFSLLAPDPEFSWSRYLDALDREIAAFGFKITTTTRPRNNASSIESAFLKANTKTSLLEVHADPRFVDRLPANQLTKIKIEVDVTPPPHFSTEMKLISEPTFYYLRAFAPGDLFAGKMHAVLCRNWQSRVKGRDWYDLTWYVQRRIPLNLAHLQSRMHDSGHLDPETKLSESRFKKILADRIDRLDIDTVKIDAQRFLPDPSGLEIWSRAFFHDFANHLHVQPIG